MGKKCTVMHFIGGQIFINCDTISIIILLCHLLKNVHQSTTEEETKMEDKEALNQCIVK